MNAEILTNLSFEEYSEMGGRLDQEGLDSAKEAWSKIESGKEIDVRHPTLRKANSMAGKCLNIDLKQKILYCFLRENKIRPLGDEELFADALVMTRDKVNRETFRANYPYIFNKDF